MCHRQEISFTYSPENVLGLAMNCTSPFVKLTFSPQVKSGENNKNK